MSESSAGVAFTTHLAQVGLSVTLVQVARLDEIAEGVATVLAASPTPEPLFLDMMNHAPPEVTFLIRAVVDASERRGAPLSSIRVGNTLGSNAARTLGPGPLAYEGVVVELDVDLDQRLEFYRFPKDRNE